MRPPRDERLIEATAGAARLLGLKQAPQLGVTALVPTPLSLGVSRPRIVFPETLEAALGDEELQGILLHETAHIAHRDHYVVKAQGGLKSGRAVSHRQVRRRAKSPANRRPIAAFLTLYPTQLT